MSAAPRPCAPASRRGRCRGALLITVAMAAICGQAAGSTPPAATSPTAAAPRAAAPTPAAGTTIEPQERVLNVTLVPAGAVPRTGHQPAPAPLGRRRATPAGRLAVKRGRLYPEGGSAGSAGALWLGLAALAALVAAGRLAWRRRPPRCGNCGAATRRLPADAAFAELDMAERTEQLVGDVRYTVWRCTACGEVEKRGQARDVGGLIANATAPPVGSAAFLRRRGQSGLSIWSPPAGGGAASHRKPLGAFPRSPRPTMPADDPQPTAPSGDVERL